MVNVTTTQSLKMLTRYLRPLRWRVVLLGSLLLGGITLQLLAPQFIRRFLDMAQNGEMGQALLNTAVFYFFIVLGQKILSLASVYVGEDVGWAATNGLRVDLARHVLRLDMGFHKLHTPGELIERIDGDVGTLAEYFSQLIVQVLGNSLLVIGILVLQFREDWRFGLIGLTYALVTLFFLRAIQPVGTRLWAQIRQGYAEMFGFLEERFHGTEDIRANGSEAYVLASLYPMMAKVNAVRVKESLWGGFTFSVGHILYVLAWIATLGIAGAGFLRGELSIGAVYLVAFYVGLLESPLKYIRRQIGNLQQAFASIGRIHEFLQLQPQVQERETAVLTPTAPTVQFNGVHFAYNDRLSANGDSSAATDYILHDVTFTLENGRILGILGRTGSGKTTLTRLLFRLYDVDKGTITLHGTDLRDVSLANLRQHVGMVTQDVQLFAATVRDNLTLFRNYDTTQPPISDAQIIHALDELGLRDWLDSLPHGLDTELGSGGQGLSAGEAQLLALTRVFLHDPKLIILDEASSRLDPATEQRLERALDRLLQGSPGKPPRTGIIIAHRLGTVQRADDILILENGRIVEHGPRLNLLAASHSRFAQLMRAGLEEVLA
ncbi:MAG: ABC transporter ATP-binding protein [Ardenticatenaceae bacterium]|nr:ABC transporter ATP-binding protein [Ardenticatenaceae bacterium]